MVSSGRTLHKSSSPYCRVTLPRSHLHPYRVMAEEASNLPPGEDTTRVRVLVERHHLYSQRLQLRRIESPERQGEEMEKDRCSFKLHMALCS